MDSELIRARYRAACEYIIRADLIRLFNHIGWELPSPRFAQRQTDLGRFLDSTKPGSKA